MSDWTRVTCDRCYGDGFGGDDCTLCKRCGGHGLLVMTSGDETRGFLMTSGSFLTWVNENKMSIGAVVGGLVTWWSTKDPTMFFAALGAIFGAHGGSTSAIQAHARMVAKKGS